MSAEQRFRAIVRFFVFMGARTFLFMNSTDLSKHEQRFFTRTELADLLHVRPGRIRQWERRGLIPRIAPEGTRLVLYPRSAVLAWLARLKSSEAANGGLEDSSHQIPQSSDAGLMAGVVEKL